MIMVFLTLRSEVFGCAVFPASVVLNYVGNIYGQISDIHSNSSITKVIRKHEKDCSESTFLKTFADTN